MLPFERLCAQLRLWRDHAAPFSEAWPRAVETTLSTLEHDRVSWGEVFADPRVEAGYRSAYERVPPARAERALLAIADGLEPQEVGLRCERCDRLIAPRRGAGVAKRWCGDRCRREAAREHVAHARAVPEIAANDTARDAATLAGPSILAR
jgi:hypothetical protein